MTRRIGPGPTSGRKCTIETCDRMAVAHELCQAHYMRRRAGVSPEDMLRPVRETMGSERGESMRIAIRYLIGTGHIAEGKKTGALSRLAEHFGVTRERMRQIASEELRRVKPKADRASVR